MRAAIILRKVISWLLTILSFVVLAYGSLMCLAWILGPTIDYAENLGWQLFIISTVVSAVIFWLSSQFSGRVYWSYWISALSFSGTQIVLTFLLVG